MLALATHAIDTHAPHAPLDAKSVAVMFTTEGMRIPPVYRHSADAAGSEPTDARAALYALAEVEYWNGRGAPPPVLHRARASAERRRVHGGGQKTKRPKTRKRRKSGDAERVMAAKRARQ